MDIDRLVIGIGCSNSDYNSDGAKEFIKRAKSGGEYSNETIFSNTDPTTLAVLLFNYPLVHKSYFKEFAQAVKKISLAKYTLCKKSSAFKDNFNKLINELFNKFHSSDVNLKDQKDQIQKVKYAVALINYIGELYNIDYIINCNIKHYLDVLVKASETSKISEDCLYTLISIISDHAKNEAKQLHKHNFDVHTAAIIKILEGSYGKTTTNLNKNKSYKDLEIIEAVKKMEEGNKNGKTQKLSLKKNQEKAEAIRQAKKIFETILMGYPIMSCVQTAHDIFLLFPETFANEMFQLCLDHLKKGLVNTDEYNNNNSTTTFIAIGKFIGKLYCAEVFNNDIVKNTLSLISRFAQARISNTIHNVIINSIHNKVMETDDEILKPLMPTNFEGFTSSDGETDSEPDSVLSEAPVKKFKEEVKMERKKEEKKPVILNQQQQQNSTSSVQVVINVSPINKFKNLLQKLSNSNVTYILREISQIHFMAGEETIIDVAKCLIEHALKKQCLIKSIVQMCLKLPETIMPHFNMSLMKKHVKNVISNSVIGCSEDRALGCGQLVKELHIVGIYDRFDIILLLENFTINFDNDRTALSTLLKFTDELKDVFINNKKLSKNMSIKFKRIAQILFEQIRNENYAEYKAEIDSAIRFYNGEYKLNNINHQNSKDDDDTEPEEETYSEPTQLLIGPLTLTFPSRKSTPVQNIIMTSPPPPTSFNQPPPPYPTQVVIVNNEVSPNCLLDQSPARPFTPDLAISETSSVDLQNTSDELYSTVVECGHHNTSVISSIDSTFDDDHFYDSVPHHDVVDDNDDNDSCYRFLEESTRNKMGELRELILLQILEVHKFVNTMLLLGTKFQSLENFMNFLKAVEEALKKQSKEVNENFIVNLEIKIPSYIEKLWGDLGQSEKVRFEIERLVVIAGIFYNKSFLNDAFFVKILEKMWSEIEDVSHAKLLIRLIITCTEKVVKNGLGKICKNYLDNLVEYNHSFGNNNDRKELLDDALEAIQLLMIHSKSVVKKEPEVVANPAILINNLISEVDVKNFNSIIKKIKLIGPVKKADLEKIIDHFIKNALSNYTSNLYVKLAEKIRNLQAIDVQSLTFKSHLDEKLKEEISKCLDDEKNMEVIMLKWTLFIGQLYLSNVVTIELITRTFETLFQRESNNKKIIDAIAALMKMVGQKVDNENDKVLENFFTYFSLISASESTYRTTIYKELIDLRKNKWKVQKQDVIQMNEYLKQLRRDNLIEVTKLIGEMFKNSDENIKEFIDLLWKSLMMMKYHPDLIHRNARLVQGLTYLNASFNPIFIDFMVQRNKTFCLIPLQDFSSNISTKLSTIIHFMCYLYAIDIVKEDHLEIWIRPSLVQHLNVDQNSELSIILGPKVINSLNVNVKAFYTFLEFNVKEQLAKAFDDVNKKLCNAD